jgi:type IV pilus biogenesis protein PilP
MLEEKFMFEITKAVGMCLALLCGTSTAQTIDEIVELNRQAAIAEAKTKVETAKKAGGGSAPAAPSGTLGSAAAFPLPPGAPAAPAPAWKMVPAKKGPSGPPALMAIYGVGGSLIAELSESGSEGKYREGDKTPGGWTVSRIDKRNVDVTRQGTGKRKGAKFQKVALAFGTKVEVPKEPLSITREQALGSYSMPPLPSSFPTGR